MGVGAAAGLGGMGCTAGEGACTTLARCTRGCAAKRGQAGSEQCIFIVATSRKTPGKVKGLLTWRGQPPAPTPCQHGIQVVLQRWYPLSRFRLLSKVDKLSSRLPYARKLLSAVQRCLPSSRQQPGEEVLPLSPPQNSTNLNCPRFHVR